MSENENEILEQIVEEDEVAKEEIVLDLLNPMVIKLESQNELHSRVSIEPFERGLFQMVLWILLNGAHFETPT